ncbi:MAG: hypothetical protein RR225_05335 [Clostridium sp.]
MIGKYVIVRSDKAGVFAGTLEEKNKNEVVLSNCRRIWRWEGACSLSQMAVDGTKKPKECNFSMTVDEIVILDVIEIIPCTKEAETSIKGVGVWKI